MSVLMSIKALYPQMGRGEKRIADWILLNPHKIIGMSISELADVCGCGDATIVRFSRRLGLSGYQGLKIGVAQELSTLEKSRELSVVAKGDSCFEIFKKREQEVVAALEYTRNILDPQALESAAKAIMGAKNIVLFGLGNSAPIVIDAQHKFLRANLPARAYSDNHMQAIVASHLSKNDVAIGVSHSGSSTDVVYALKLAQQQGAKTICITNHNSSPITKHSDICLFTKAEESKQSMLAMSSRYAQLCIIDAIYNYIVINKPSDTLGALRETERALEEKKY